MKQASVFIITVLMSVSAMAGNWFPPDYKEFPFKEGDLLTSEKPEGKYSINKVLRIDNVCLDVGQSISIQGQVFMAPEKDCLLIISMSYGEHEFKSLEEINQAVKKGIWKVKIGHIPNRAPGAAEGQILIGHSPVKQEELAGYNQWKELFSQGKAGVF
ncbi:hypothetical protein [Rheinheimera pacifica]|uniref:hypothetical protein n=1 Tax=Rheinheimera pacifica TaxID=173990 RepID=UPI002ED98F62